MIMYFLVYNTIIIYNSNYGSDHYLLNIVQVYSMSESLDLPVAATIIKQLSILTNVSQVSRRSHHAWCKLALITNKTKSVQSS